MADSRTRWFSHTHDFLVARAEIAMFNVPKLQDMSEPTITPALIEKHGITPEEYVQVFGGAWPDSCSGESTQPPGLL